MKAEKIVTISNEIEKQTPLPEGWQRIKLGECLTLINGRAYSQHEMLSSGTPIIRIQNLNGSNRWYYSDLKLPEHQYCDYGDLLFAWSATFGAFVWTGHKAIFHYHIWKVVPHDNLDKNLAFYLLQEITESIKNASHGLAMLHMTKGGMENWTVNLPPIEEQRRIATVLDGQMKAVEQAQITLVEQLEAATLLSNAFLRSIFESEEAQKWERKKISQWLESGFIEEIQDGNHGEIHPRASEYVKSGVPFVMANCIKGNKLDLSSCSYISKERAASLRIGFSKKGDVLLTHKGSIGLTAIVPHELDLIVLTPQVTYYRPNTTFLDASFLNMAFRQPEFQQQLSSIAKQATRDYVGITAQKDLYISIPSLEVQKKIAKKLNEQIQEVENLKKTLVEQLEAIKKMPSALLRNAFAGEI